MSPTLDKSGPEAGRGRSGRQESWALLRGPTVGGGRQHPAEPDGRAAQALLSTTVFDPTPSSKDAAPTDVLPAAAPRLPPAGRSAPFLPAARPRTHNSLLPPFSQFFIHSAGSSAAIFPV